MNTHKENHESIGEAGMNHEQNNFRHVDFS